MSLQDKVLSRKPRSGSRLDIDGVSFVCLYFLSLASIIAFSTSDLEEWSFQHPFTTSDTWEMEKSVVESLVDKQMARNACRCFSFSRCLVSSIAKDV